MNRFDKVIQQSREKRSKYKPATKKPIVQDYNPRKHSKDWKFVKTLDLRRGD